MRCWAAPPTNPQRNKKANMKMTSKTRYITNGTQVIKLGYYYPSDRKKKSDGDFYNNKGYPNCVVGAFDRSNRIPMFWLSETGNGYMREFRPIKKALLSKEVLKHLEAA